MKISTLDQGLGLRFRREHAISFGIEVDPALGEIWLVGPAPTYHGARLSRPDDSSTMSSFGFGGRMLSVGQTSAGRCKPLLSMPVEVRQPAPRLDACAVSDLGHGTRRRLVIIGHSAPKATLLSLGPLPRNDARDGFSDSNHLTAVSTTPDLVARATERALPRGVGTCGKRIDPGHRV
jgi:hypothetical protein